MCDAKEKNTRKRAKKECNKHRFREQMCISGPGAIVLVLAGSGGEKLFSVRGNNDSLTLSFFSLPFIHILFRGKHVLAMKFGDFLVFSVERNNNKNPFFLGEGNESLSQTIYCSLFFCVLRWIFIWDAIKMWYIRRRGSFCCVKAGSMMSGACYYWSWSFESC